MRAALEYARQTDFRGGINEEPENAQPNQVLDARNVWCPEGRLEQRPGYRGVTTPLGATVSGGHTDVILLGFVSPNFATSSAGGTLNIGGYGEGDLWFFGFSKAPVANNVVGFRVSVTTANANDLFQSAQYYNGSEWVALEVREFISAEANYIAGGVTGVHRKRAAVALEDTGLHTFAFITPADMTSVSVNTYDRYWIKFTLRERTVSATLTANTTLDNGAVTDPIILGASSKGVAGMFHVEYGQSGKRFYVVPKITSGGSIVAYDADGLRESHKYLHAVAGVGGDTQGEAATIAFNPQYGEAYVMYKHAPLVFKRYATISDDPRAKVEDSAGIIGEYGGIKNPYHPGYIAQLDHWPRAKFTTYFQGQMWAANVEGSSYEIRWSAPLEAYKVWPAESFTYVVEDDSSPITGISALGEYLIVFKRDSIWMMVDGGFSDLGLNRYIPRKIVHGVGCVSSGSIQKINGRLVFLAEDGVYMFDGSPNIQKLSEPIDPMVARIVPGRMPMSTSVHWRTKRCYLLSVALDDGPANDMTLVYDYKHGAWWFWAGFDVDAWMKVEGQHDDEQLYFGDNKGRIYRFDEGYTDHGATPEVYVETHRWFYDEPIARNARNGWVYADNENNTVTAEVTADDEPSGTSNTLTYLDTNEPKFGAGVFGTATFTKRRRRFAQFEVNKYGHWYQIKLTNTNKGQPLKADRIVLGTTSLGLR